MHRMTGTDASFLYAETNQFPTHTLKISIVDPGGDYSFQRAKDYFARNIHRLPPLRWRVLPTPMRINHPIMVEDPDFDIDFHVHRMYCPPPGTSKEFGELVADLVRRPIDRSRPLWEAYLVEGLEGGKVASVVKLHHALADGAAAAALLNEIYVTTPGTDHPPEATPWQPAPLPGKAKLLAWGVRDAVQLVKKEGPVFLARAKQVKIWRKNLAADPSLKAPAPFTAPLVDFPEELSSEREFAFATLSLDEAKRVRAAFETTINDVALSITAGTLRRYLLARNLLPSQPLVALMPFTTRDESDKPLWGNHVYGMYVRLRTDIADPLERLRAARSEALLSKEEFVGTRGARIDDMLELGPPIFANLLLKLSRFYEGAAKKTVFNLAMSNVQGPAELLYAGTHPVTAFYSAANPAEDVPLVVMMWSYVDQLNFGLLSDRRRVPGLWQMIDWLGEELRLLVKAVEAAE